jgi:hypothetical protein
MKTVDLKGPCLKKNKRRKTNRNDNPRNSPARKSRISPTTFIVLGLVVVAALGVWSWKSKRDRMPPTMPMSSKASTSNPPAGMAVAKPDFQKLKGKWLRPDGGYIIEIKNMADDGALDAGYFNPQPIRVSKAQASSDGAAMKVFIELSDKNYPGSTYTLAYEPERDQLKGIYYQALQQQSFEVVFVRSN